MDKPVKVSERFISVFAVGTSTDSVTCGCGKTHFASSDEDIIKFFDDTTSDDKIVIGCECETDIVLETFIKYFEPQIAAYLDLSSKREVPQHHGDIDEHHEQGHS